jgi:hypothetical protein
VRNRAQDIVALYVGPQRECFEIPAKILSDNSSFFRDLFARNPGQNVFRLLDTNAVAFGKLHEWLYGDPSVIAKGITLGALNCGELGIQEMLEAYIAARKLKFTALEDLAMGLLGLGYYSSNIQPSSAHFELAHRETSQDSKLRFYLAISFYYSMMNWEQHGPSANTLTVARQYPQLQDEFFSMCRDTMLTKGRLWKPEPVWSCAICEFHNHPKEEYCWASSHSFVTHPFRKIINSSRLVR